MSLPAGTRVRKVDHRGPSNLTGTVADWSFSDPKVGRFRSLVRWDTGVDQFCDDFALLAMDQQELFA